ncbi:AAA family ATPase [Aliarcobacter skirrowii]|uniref:AAA family ATPase n=1 Tax=Aliarcobacter skirrowii TaxID=28200 RepID=UPI0029ABBE4D|nr:AAA family ATPase [Aliarcobacter skirrowii]MDX4036320.1 AAA family ATPase [Aliarcobacter skirrowii]
MELVYLWVEKYKNIKEQGFNFSPNFECEFFPIYEKYRDENGEEKEKLKEDCELKIIPKENPLKDIFGKNINVTAIVGENGSGKSSILSVLIDLFTENLDEDEYRNYIAIYKYQEKYHYIKKHIQENINIVDKDKNSINWITENPNNRLFTWHSELLGLIIQNEINSKINSQREQIFIEEVQNKDKNRIKKYMIMNSILDSKFKKESNKFFDVKNVEIKIKWGNLFNSKREKEKYESEALAEIETKFNEAKENFKNKKYKDTFLNIINICDMRIKKLKHHGGLNFFKFPYQEDRENLSCQSHIVKNQDIKDVHQIVINTLDNYDNFTFKIEQLNNNIIDFIFDLPEHIFDIQLKDENKSFENLSFGERQLLTQLNFIQFYINKKQYIQYEGIDYFEDENNVKHEVDIDIEKKVKSMIVLIDELEIGLHPNWQKNAINYITDFLQNIKDIDFNLIITSHSPFILSDLSKENVIFLEKGKQVYPFEDGKQTFGANIHTLLSHGFFMKDGLMGEFAKEKIDLAIDYLNKPKLSKKELEYCENIISIIGEPIIKRQLQKMLDSKRLKKIDEIDKIYDEIEFLKHRIEILRKNQ